MNDSNEDIFNEFESEPGTSGQSGRKRLGKNNKIDKTQKELLITLFEDGETLKKAALMADINLNTAKSILRAYRKNDCDIIEKPRGGKRHEKLTADVLDKIEKLIEDNANVTIREIKIQLAKENIHLSKSTIASGLIKLKIT